MNPRTLLAVLQLFSLFVFATWGLWWWWFLDPAVDLLSATVDWTCYSCFTCCCVLFASQNIYRHWNSIATCWPTQQVCWYLPVVPLCHQGFLLCGKVWYHLQNDSSPLNFFVNESIINSFTNAIILANKHVRAGSIIVIELVTLPCSEH